MSIHQAHNIVVTPDLFWHGINVLITKPHVVNKRLWGCKLLGRHNCKAMKKVWESSTLPVKLQDPENVDAFLNAIVICLETELIPTNNEDRTEIIVMELLPRNFNEKHAFQLILLDKIDCKAIFYDITPTEHNQNLCPSFTYKLYLNDQSVGLEADTDKSSKPYQWLLTIVLPQLQKWSQDAVDSTHMSVNKSLALVPNDQYYIKYNILKEKYGKELVKIWPECTDPSKFVYEDIAIATYLLLLWEESQEENNATSQSFVDMGCGNGLLVYILSMEGHNGYGIDVRKRKIWDLFPDNITLLEMTLTPSNIHTFAEVDWIIGNHSDELTPWIPAIAAKSSYKCKYFLLPCCAYNFNGTKYQRKDSSVSQYSDYLQYIHKLSEDCGFQTYTDRLKIPSTKRICFVGKKRKHPLEEYNKYCEHIETLISSSSCTYVGVDDESTKGENFKAREATERVRNCTQVDRKVVESIISCVTKYLLEGCKQDSEWSPGKTVHISEVVSLLPQDTLKLLKSECGGLQTLLKNNHQIFKVQNGNLQLKYPKSINEMNRSTITNKRFKSDIKLRVKECWFYRNHPQGCPLKDTECSFLH